ncbi:uncharacterized protein N0V89_009974 [Didymosphaeria variabile]|uniref:Arrestin-like N-terminal domain-containing protein n=1 Tax=Didymosphaeria variabile TaxID=1932322 RepID=A0A9W9C7U3_9PLEO|nr:uncharacterized protein N0V89_009974 [Didymosphaeria variabile]KAJ4348596.1 hypothetical protein N0V89_009974 [Didymosphaeria variabile]
MKCAITRSNGQSSTTYKEKPEFFSRTLELYSSPTGGQSYDIVCALQGVTEDNRVELPFEFTWPERTELSPGSKWLPNPSFEHECGGPLPPTYYRGSSNEQLVEYFLEARLYTGGRYNAAQEVRCPLNYRPSPSIPSPIPQVPDARTIYSRTGIIARTHRLHPEYDPDEGWRARIKHSWNKDKDTTPYANYKIDVSCPSVVTSGQPVILSLSLVHLERSKDIPDPPPVYLRRISVRLSSCLRVRIPSRSLFGSSDMDESHNDKHIFLEKSFNMGEGLLMYDGMTATTAEVPLRLAPAFSTYGLELTQKLKVELWGECAREKFRFTPIQGPILVVACGNAPSLPPPPTPAHKDAKATESAAEAPPSMEEDTAPPPYQVLDKS